MKNRIIFYLLSLIIVFDNKAYAFIAPNLIAGNFSTFVYSIGIILGFILASVPIVWFFLKNIFKRFNTFTLIIIENLILISLFAGVFYFKYYKPLLQDFQSLFEAKSITNNVASSIYKKNDNNIIFSKNSIKIDEVNKIHLTNQPANIKDLSGANRMNILEVESGFLVSKEMIDAYSVNIQDIQNSVNPVYFIDVREKEEFEHRRIKNAVHIRAGDVNKETIKSKLSLSDEDFNNSMFVMYCETSDRSAWVADKLKIDNLKFFYPNPIRFPAPILIEHNLVLIIDELQGFKEIEGDTRQFSTQPFPSKYGDLAKFYLTRQEIDKLISNNKVMVFNGVIAEDIEGVEKFIVPYTETPSYEKIIQKIISNMEKEILMIIHNRSEVYFAQLLFFMLEKKYDHDFNKLHITALEEWYKEK